MLEHPKRLLLIFLKEPIAGKVKTRLAATVGEDQAVLIYRALVKTLLEQLQWVSDCHYRFCFAPADAQEAMQFWLLPDLAHRLEVGTSRLTPLAPEAPSIDFAPQVEGDLGARLHAAVKQGFGEGFEQVTMIGADCPFVSARWLEAAFMAGTLADVTVGPTPDGGYFMMQMQAYSPAPFTDIPWSTAQTLAVTLERLHAAGLSTQLLPSLSDIDHEEDWLAALDSPLGARLKKNLQAVSASTFY